MESLFSRNGWVFYGIFAFALTIRANADDMRWRPLSAVSVPVWKSATLPGGTRVAIEIPGFFEKEKSDADSSYSEISFPGWGKSAEKGEAELPRKTLSIPIAGGMTPVVEILEEVTERIPGKSVLPSLGDLTRAVRSPEKLLRVRGSIYGKREYPAAKVLSVFRVRGQSGAMIDVRPFRWDEEKGELVITKKLVLLVRSGGEAARIQAPRSQAEADLFRGAFPEEKSILPVYPTEAGKLLVVGTKEALGLAEDWMEWKRERGFQVDILGVEATGRNAEALKAAIMGKFRALETTHVVLLGGDAEVPTISGTTGNVIGAEADPTYALLDGEDSIPDLYVSRFPSRSPAELQSLLDKAMRYETDPAPGTWASRGAFIASDEGQPTDGQRADILRGLLSPAGFDVESRFYDPHADLASFLSGLEKGFGLVNYIGHGSETSWGTTRLSNTDLMGVRNGGRLPLVVSVACVNGVFRSASEGFGERWVKGAQDGSGGAIAIFASSTNQSWVPPTVGQMETARLLASGEATSVGALLFGGSTAVVRDGSESAEQTFQSWHIFGDATIDVRTRDAEEIEFNLPAAFRRTDRLVRIPISPRRKPMRIALTNGDGLLGYGEAAAGASEIALRVDRPLGFLEPARLTVSGPDLRPYRQTVFGAN